MPNYNFFALDTKGSITQGLPAEEPSDVAAVSRAQSLVDAGKYSGVEIWDHGRLVGIVRKITAPSPT